MQSIQSKAGDTVGLLLYQHLKRDDDIAEQALFDINPGLARYGAVLPAGLTIYIPELAAAPVQKVVRVWD